MPYAIGPRFCSTVLKRFGQLAKFFGQMVYRPPWQKIARTPMIERVLNLSQYNLLQSFVNSCSMI